MVAFWWSQVCNEVKPKESFQIIIVQIQYSRRLSPHHEERLLEAIESIHLGHGEGRQVYLGKVVSMRIDLTTPSQGVLMR